MGTSTVHGMQCTEKVAEAVTYIRLRVHFCKNKISRRLSDESFTNKTFNTFSWPAVCRRVFAGEREIADHVERASGGAAAASERAREALGVAGRHPRGDDEQRDEHGDRGEGAGVQGDPQPVPGVPRVQHAVLPRGGLPAGARPGGGRFIGFRWDGER